MQLEKEREMETEEKYCDCGWRRLKQNGPFVRRALRKLGEHQKEEDHLRERNQIDDENDLELVVCEIQML